MNTSKFRIFIIGSLFLVVFVLLFAFVKKPTPSSASNNVLNLEAPSFVDIAKAETSSIDPEIAAQLDTEAGISAYFKSPYTIDLSLVQGVFRTTEISTTDYILGSVAVPNHPEHFDVHVYVHTDGWILAYYMKGDPASKIIDVRDQTIDNTKLTTVVARVASAAGAPYSDVSYYDFRYPNATNMILVAEDRYNGIDFTIELPSSGYGYFEGGWAAYDSYADRVFVYDGSELRTQATWSGSSMWYGKLTASQLRTGTPPHTILVDTNDNAYGVLIIIYSVL